MLDYAASSTLKNPIYADSCCFFSESSESFIKGGRDKEGEKCKTHFLVLFVRNVLLNAETARWLQIACLCIISEQLFIWLNATEEQNTPRLELVSKSPHLLTCHLLNEHFSAITTFSSTCNLRSLTFRLHNAAISIQDRDSGSNFTSARHLIFCTLIYILLHWLPCAF